ncbi:hypothetical protein LC613_40240 [Nostoc sphaeroides CHAB 2801]|nr:hypothetical protein [Nostoc sphaeroides]MCC5633665.1 hypothetical protein [Nostoc sphaeroides CHAB 2801]
MRSHPSSEERYQYERSLIGIHQPFGDSIRQASLIGSRAIAHAHPHD